MTWNRKVDADGKYFLSDGTNEIREGSYISFLLISKSPHKGLVKWVKHEAVVVTSAEREYYIPFDSVLDLIWGDKAADKYLTAREIADLNRDLFAQVLSNPNKGSSAAAEHYVKSALQPIEVMQRLLSLDEFKGFLKGNVIKYKLRAGHKGDASTDHTKAKQYKYWLDLVEKDPDRMIDPIKDTVLKE